MTQTQKTPEDEGEHLPPDDEEEGLEEEEVPPPVDPVGPPEPEK